MFQSNTDSSIQSHVRFTVNHHTSYIHETCVSWNTLTCVYIFGKSRIYVQHTRWDI